MAKFTWEYRPEDNEFFYRELESFVPDRIYDAHCHLHELSHMHYVEGSRYPSKYRSFSKGGYYALMEAGPHSITLEEYRRQVDWLHPGREVHSLCMPYVPVADPPAANHWVSRQIAKDPLCRGHFVLMPDDDPEWVRQECRRLNLCGLKPYHMFLPHQDTMEAEIPEYLPEKFLSVANEEGWSITLHMVRSRAIADPSNQRWIRRYCENYPNVNIILDHTARAFNPGHNVEGLAAMRGLDNLWYVSSLYCEPLAREAVIRIIGPEKLIYGSDFFCSHDRGRSLGVNDGFLFINEMTDVWKTVIGNARPVLMGLEHLRALKYACWSQGLTDSQVEDIFYNTAARLLGVDTTQARRLRYP